MYDNKFPAKLMADIATILEIDANKMGRSCPHCGKLICECGFMEDVCMECEKPFEECECADPSEDAEAKPSDEKEEIIINPPLETQRY